MKQVAVILILALLPLALRADKQETIESLKTRADASQGKQQVELCTKVAEQQMKAADAGYTAGNVQQAQAALADVVSYGLKAAKTSASTGKRMKQTEIALRRIAERLDAVRKSVEVDDRPPVADAIQKLEAARTELLNAMFRK